MVYNNVGRKRHYVKRNDPQKTTLKATLQPKEVTLYFCWNWKGNVHYGHSSQLN